MNIEEKIFKKLKIDYTKLLDYGFVKENNTYKFLKEIMNNTFEVQISINKDGSVNGKVFDKEFEDEYVIFRMENAVGTFVFNLGMSIGWHTTLIDSSTRIEDCLAESDRQMYEMKKKHHTSSQM